MGSLGLKSCHKAVDPYIYQRKWPWMAELE
jgi:hypothetical protein